MVIHSPSKQLLKWIFGRIFGSKVQISLQAVGWR